MSVAAILAEEQSQSGKGGERALGVCWRDAGAALVACDDDDDDDDDTRSSAVRSNKQKAFSTHMALCHRRAAKETKLPRL